MLFSTAFIERYQLLTLGGLSLFIAVIFYAVFNFPAQFFTPSGVSPIVNVESAANLSRARQPSDGLAWVVQVLPDDWLENKKEADDHWYQYRWSIESISEGAAAEKTMAVYLPMVSHNVSVFINGTWVGQGGDFEEPIARNHNTPLLFPFSSSLLRHGDNTLHLRVGAATSAQGLLGEIYLSEFDELKNAYKFKYLIRISLVKWLTGVMLVLSFILLCFWMYRRYDSAYGVFSLVLFFWGLHNLNIFVVDILVASKHWETLAILTLGWTVSSVILFDHRYLNKKVPKIEKVMLAHSVLGFLLFLTPDYSSLLFWGYKVWYAFLMLFGLYASCFLFSSYLKEKDRDALLMLVVGSVIVVFGVHDILLVNHHWNRFDGFILQYSAIPTVILFGWFLLQRFLKSLETAENLAATLEQRVEQKQLELEDQYSKLIALEKQQVLSDERERMMRDMHDGFGGSLVSLSSMFQKEDGDVFQRAYDKVQTSITDLRLVIDSLDPMLNDLTTLLATMRARLMDQLESAGVNLEWNVCDTPVEVNFSPQQSLHVMRIIQEAITNSVKHSDSSRLSLSTSCSPDANIVISIRDYGAGMTDLEGHCGHGLTNMRWRAKQLGGELKLIAHSPGTEVQLILARERI